MVACGVVASWLTAGAAHAVLTTLSYSPAAGSLSELGSNHAYTWRLDDLPTGPVTGATLTFSGIGSSEAGANKFFGHLLDSASSAGVSSFLDGGVGRGRLADITDDFASTRHHGSPDWLVAPGTSDTKLFSKSFTATPNTWTYTFNEKELTQLNQYLTDGSIAFGFDSDSHYINQGITFSMIVGAPAVLGAMPPGVSPMPEPATVLPLAVVLVMAVAVQSRSRRRGENFSEQAA